MKLHLLQSALLRPHNEARAAAQRLWHQECRVISVWFPLYFGASSQLQASAEIKLKRRSGCFSAVNSNQGNKTLPYLCCLSALVPNLSCLLKVSKQFCQAKCESLVHTGCWNPGATVQVDSLSHGFHLSEGFQLSTAHSKSRHGLCSLIIYIMFLLHPPNNLLVTVGPFGGGTPQRKEDHVNSQFHFSTRSHSPGPRLRSCKASSHIRNRPVTTMAGQIISPDKNSSNDGLLTVVRCEAY